MGEGGGVFDGYGSVRKGRRRRNLDVEDFAASQVRRDEYNTVAGRGKLIKNK